MNKYLLLLFIAVSHLSAVAQDSLGLTKQEIRQNLNVLKRSERVINVVSYHNASMFDRTLVSTVNRKGMDAKLTVFMLETMHLSNNTVSDIFDQGNDIFDIQEVVYAMDEEKLQIFSYLAIEDIVRIVNKSVGTEEEGFADFVKNMDEYRLDENERQAILNLGGHVYVEETESPADTIAEDVDVSQVIDPLPDSDRKSRFIVDTEFARTLYELGYYVQLRDYINTEKEAGRLEFGNEKEMTECVDDCYVVIISRSRSSNQRIINVLLPGDGLRKTVKDNREVLVTDFDPMTFGKIFVRKIQ